MRLISCDINHFGRFSEEHMEFQKGLMEVNEANGWGKTTLAAYIKAMFYGMEYTRGNKVTDRKHYEPWNGGNYGGSLTFEVGEKKYKVVRTFGKRDKEDTFSLIDLEKNQETVDYSANLGEELWGVNRDSYERTAFISLAKSEPISDELASKLENRTQQETDMDVSSQAIVVLSDRIKSYVKRGNKGLIEETKEQIRQLKAKREKDKASEVKVSERRSQLEEVSKQVEELREKEKSFAGTYDRINGCLNEESELKTIGEKFQLSEAETEEYQALQLRYQLTGESEDGEKKSKKSKKRREERKRKSKYTQVEDNPIDVLKENMENFESDCGIVRNLKQEEAKFDAKIMDFHKQHPESAKRAANQDIQEEQRKIFGKLNTGARLASNCSIAGFLFIIIGVFLMNENFIYSLIALVPGFALVIYGLLKKKKVEEAREKALRNMKVNPGKATKISEILAKRDIGEEKIKVYEEQYRSLLIVTDKGNIDLLEGMTEVQNELKRYKQLDFKIVDNKERAERAEQQLMESQRELESALLEYFHERPENPIEALEISNHEIQEKLVSLVQKQNQMINQMKCLHEEIDEVDDLDDLDNEISCLEEKLEQYEKESEYLEAAKKSMIGANQDLAARYVSDMTKGFREYMSFLATEHAEYYSVDLDLNVLEEDIEQRHQFQKLNQGLQDMIQICMRLALVDAVYKDFENPILVVDGPLANLDDQHLEQAMQLLQTVGERYQVVYFTCKSSRI